LDEYADLQKLVDGTKGCIAACIALKKKNPSLKVILSIGGGSGSQHFAALASKLALREQFSQAAALLVRKHGFDGVDCK
jgi:chitinase